MPQKLSKVNTKDHALDNTTDNTFRLVENYIVT